MMPEVVFVGTGEACDPALPNNSLLYRGAQTVLCDCGYSVPQALWRVTRDAEALDAIFISHSHADHLFGLPGLLLWLRQAGRTRPLTLLASRNTQLDVTAVMELAYPGLLSASGGFALHRQVLVPGESAALGGLGLRAAQSDHGAENLALRLEEGGTAVCFSGDGRPNAATLALYRNADLLVHECYHLEPGSLGHANLAELVEQAEAAGVQQLALVHLGLDHAAELRARAGGVRRVIVPAPGDTVTIAAQGGKVSPCGRMAPV